MRSLRGLTLLASVRPSMLPTLSLLIAVPSVRVLCTQHRIVHLHWSFSSTLWNRQTLSIITKSSLTDLIRRYTIRDGGTIPTFLGSKIREEHLRMLKTNILPDFRHSSTISLLLKCLHLHLNQL